MKVNMNKKILIALPIIALVLLLVIFIVLFHKEETVLNGGIAADGGGWYYPHIEYDGHKYLFEDSLADSNMFFEVQKSWAELDRSKVEYISFDNAESLEEDIVYYDTTKPFKSDLYLRVNEEWLQYNCAITDYPEAFVRLHIYYGPQTQR